MYNENNLLHILTMLEAIEKIAIYIKDFTNEEEFFYAQKQLYFNATVNLLIAIGEESKKLDDNLKTDFTFDWKVVSAMRDKISHNYRGIDEGIVWDTIVSKLPELKNTLLLMIPHIAHYKEYIAQAIQTEYYEDLGYLGKI